MAPLTDRRRVLAVNTGSTSVKLAELEGDRVVRRPNDLDAALAPDRADPDLIVHRVVHGGDRPGPAVVDGDLLAELRALADRAPLHQAAALDVIDRCRARWPEVTQVACFDTAFHTTLPAAARTYALPARLRSEVRVVGFHGLSYAWAAGRLTDLAPDARRVVVAHLGGGQSLCGLLDGASTVTTMGFTPLDGLVMATRPGSLDPGAVLWLAEREADLGRVLAEESGLLGLAGTADLAEVLERAAAGADPDATLARDVHLLRLVQAVGAAAAALGGLDALVFTGGAGERSGTLRRLVGERLAWLGVGIVDAGPPDDAVEITAPGATVRSFVVAAQEDRQMAREALVLLA